VTAMMMTIQIRKMMIQLLKMTMTQILAMKKKLKMTILPLVMKKLMKL